MKTKMMVLFSALCLTGVAQSFQKGQKDINLGYGIANTFVNSNYSVSIPCISASIENGVSDAISFGIYLGLAKAKSAITGWDNCNNGNGNGNFLYQYWFSHEATYFIFGLKGAYHFEELIKNEKLDAYAGILLGQNFETDKYSSITSPGCEKVDGPARPFEKYAGFIWSVYAGTRYRFSEHVGIFAELGYGIVILNAGLNLKF